jgi:hypothetical protein
MSTKILVEKEGFLAPIFDSSYLAMQASKTGKIATRYPGAPAGDNAVRHETTVYHNLGYEPIVYSYFENPDGNVVEDGFYLYAALVNPETMEYGTTVTECNIYDDRVVFVVRNFGQSAPLPGMPAFDYKIYYVIVAQPADPFPPGDTDESIYYG